MLRNPEMRAARLRMPHDVGRTADDFGAKAIAVTTGMGYTPLTPLADYAGHFVYLINDSEDETIWAAVSANWAVSTTMLASGTTPPAVTLTGDAADLEAFEGAQVTIETGGARGVATFNVLINGVIVVEEELTAATFLVPDTGVTLNFADTGDYNANNAYVAVAAETAVIDPTPTPTEAGASDQITPPIYPRWMLRLRVPPLPKGSTPARVPYLAHIGSGSATLFLALGDDGEI